MQTQAPHNGTDLTHKLVDNRVHWLRAKCQLDRWTEEKKLLTLEMACTVRWFRWKKRSWQTLGEKSQSCEDFGAAGYAFRQMSLWGRMEAEATKLFTNANPGHLDA